MIYKKIIPEILLSLGDKSKTIKVNNIEKVIDLHINIETWYGDDILITNYNNCVVTEELKLKLQNEIFTGFNFENILVTKDIYFNDNYHLDKPLSKFYWMKIIGNKGEDDLYLEDFDLYASERFISYLKDNFSTNNLEINPERNEFDDFILSLIEADKKKLDN